MQIYENTLTPQNIYIISDNARYYHNKELQNWVEDNRIKQIFLASILSEPQFNRALVEILTEKSNQYRFLSEQDRIPRCYKKFL